MKRAIAFILSILTLLTSLPIIVFSADVSNEIEIPACDCGNEGKTIEQHSWVCARQSALRYAAENFTAAELYSYWHLGSDDEQAYVLKYLQDNSWQYADKLTELRILIEQGGGQDEPQEPAGPEPAEEIYWPQRNPLNAQMQIEEGTHKILVLPVSNEWIPGVEDVYCWEVYLPIQKMWLPIEGADSDTLEVSYAMFTNVLDDGKALVRCFKNGLLYAQTEIEFTAPAAEEEEVRRAPARSPLKAAPLKADSGACRITIQYLFQDGKEAAPAYVTEVLKGSPLNVTIVNPKIVGYVACNEAGDPIENVPLIYDSVSGSATITVWYNPTYVDYEVYYYLQTPEGDYAFESMDHVSGLTGSKVRGDLGDKYTSSIYHPLIYDRSLTVAADGSTKVEVYYDLAYTTVIFNLNGGYGVDSCMVRVGKKLNNVGTPKKDGYVFDYWTDSLGNHKTSLDGYEVPNSFVFFAANWKVGTTTGYVVAIFLENANDTGYTFGGSVSRDDGVTNSVINSSQFRNVTYPEMDTTHFMFNGNKIDTKTVKEDGSTVINVYYTRNTYTFKFYECSNTSGLHEHSVLRSESDLHPKDGISKACDYVLKHTITAKYESDISDLYAAYTNKKRESKMGQDVAIALVPTMPGENTVYYTSNNGDHTYTITYCLEAQGGSITNAGLSGVTYKALNTTAIVAKMGAIGSADYTNGCPAGYQCYTWGSSGAMNVYEWQVGDKVGTKVWHTISGNQGGWFSDGTYRLFYAAKTYNIAFYGHNGQNVGNASQKYTYSISGQKNAVNTNAIQAPYGYTFDYWCYDAACTQKVNWDTDTMPAHDLALYAKWKPIQCTVTLSVMRGDTPYSTFTTTLGEVVLPERRPADPINGSYVFITWNYINERGDTVAFNFDLPVTQDLQLFGEWYGDGYGTGYMYYKAEDGTTLAPPTPVTGLLASTKTYYALTDTSVIGQGYFPTVPSHSVIFSESEEANSYTFIYVKRADVPYTVHYYDRDTGIEIATAKSATSNFASVVETFKPVENYRPLAYEMQFTLSADGTNDFWFPYVQGTGAPVIVKHMLEDKSGKYNAYLTYTYDDIEIGSTYTAIYLGDPGAEDDLPIGYKKNTSHSQTKVSGTLTAAGLELKLFYDREDYPYEFRFVDQESGDEIADRVSDTEGYGTFISMDAPDFPGYILTGAETQTMTILIEDDPTKAERNVRYFYYRQKDVTFNYYLVVDSSGDKIGEKIGGTLSLATETLKAVKGSPAGSTVTLKTGYKFDGWYSNPACTSSYFVSGDLAFKPSKTGDGVYVDGNYYAKVSVLKADYTVEPWLMDTNGTYVKNTDSTYTLSDQVGSTVTASPIDFTGFTYQPTLSTASGTVAADGSLTLVMKYSRNKYDYRIEFRDAGGTHAELATAVTGNDYYQKTIAISAPSVKGYTKLSTSPTSLTIDTENNTVVVYYSENTATLTYTAVGNGTVDGKSSTSEVIAVVNGTPAGATPSATLGYGFDGWYSDPECKNLLSTDPAYKPVKTDGVYVTATYYAKFSERYADYTIKYWLKGLDGKYVLSEKDVVTGTDQVGKTISATVKTFTGFTYASASSNSSGTLVEGEELVLNLYYDRVGYTVTWENYDGTELEVDTGVLYGATPTYDGATPTKDADDDHMYEFKGWTPAVSAVTGNITYTAQFNPVNPPFTVTWKNYDGTVLETDEGVLYGATPVYNGSTPVKAQTAQYTYEFAGWSPEISRVKDNITYTAQFTPVLRSYKVVWKNYDNSVLETDNSVDYGTVPTYDGETPEKPGDADYMYRFTGWAPTVSAVTGNAEYVAQFESYKPEFTVTWKNYDGTVIKTTKGIYGEVPVYDGTTPTREQDVQYTYAFSGWDPTPAKIYDDAEYTAQYTPTLRKYTITWYDEDGETVLDTQSVDYGATPVYKGATPTKDKTAQYTYTFSGWDPEIAAVTGDAEYVAKYSSTVNKYTVTWKNYDGTVLETDKDVPYGTTPTYDGATPTKPATVEKTYIFNGWDPAVSEVTGDVTYTAKFTDQNNKFKVTYKVEGMDDYVVEYYPDANIEDYAPEKLYYDFDGWYSDSDYKTSVEVPEVMPMENLTFYGRFVRSRVSITITKSGMNAGETAIFKISGEDIADGITVVVNGNNGSITISNICAGGTYTIVEDMGWAWNYTTETTSKTVIIGTTSTSAEFVNVSKESKWVYDSARKTNTYGDN